MIKMSLGAFFNFYIDKFDVIKKIGYQLKRFFKFQAPASFALLFLKIRIKSPNTFNKKILYKIANDRSPRLMLLADKIAVREYVAERIGVEFLTKIYGVYHLVSEISLSAAPRNFVLKPNHASGAALIVADFVPKSRKAIHLSRRYLNKYYINPDSLDEKKILNLADFWLHTNYFGYHRTAFPEWAYKDIVPCVYIEELLTTNLKPPEDYRFFMFNGDCQVIMVDTPGFAGVQRDIYTPEWDLVEVEFGHPNSNLKRQKPRELLLMLEIARKLSLGVDHVRVDLYNINGRIIFGELTNYHAGGTQKFSPRAFDSKLGESWDPKKFY
jgi:hypothetical protein